MKIFCPSNEDLVISSNESVELSSTSRDAVEDTCQTMDEKGMFYLHIYIGYSLSNIDSVRLFFAFFNVDIHGSHEKLLC